MKKKFTCIKIAIGLAGWILAGCAFTDFGTRINAERAHLEKLVKKRDDAEARYVLTLNNLERFPDDPKMETERNLVRQKIQILNVRVDEQRKLFDQSIKEWEAKILQDKIQKAMIDREVKDGENKIDGEWNESR